MKTIKEYFLNKKTVSPQTLYMPVGAKIVNILENGSNVRLVTVIDPNETLTNLRTFKICTNTESIYNDNIEYLGSFISAFGDRHVIELL